MDDVHTRVASGQRPSIRLTARVYATNVCGAWVQHPQATKITLKQFGPLLRADEINDLLQTLADDRNVIYGEFLHALTKRIVRPGLDRTRISPRILSPRILRPAPYLDPHLRIWPGIWPRSFPASHSLACSARVDASQRTDPVLQQPGQRLPDGRGQLFPLDVVADTRQRSHVYWCVKPCLVLARSGHKD